MYRSLFLLGLLALAGCSRPAAVGNLEIIDAWARAAAPGQSTAVYATISNEGPADRLIGAATSRGSTVMLHENRSGDGISRMRMVDSIPIPAAGTVMLAPGGTHLMLSGGPPFLRGETFDLRLRFAAGGEKLAKVSIVAPGSR